MGKGDKKSKKGKLHVSSWGKSRPARKQSFDSRLRNKHASGDSKKSEASKK